MVSFNSGCLLAFDWFLVLLGVATFCLFSPLVLCFLVWGLLYRFVFRFVLWLVFS